MMMSIEGGIHRWPEKDNAIVEVKGGGNVVVLTLEYI